MNSPIQEMWNARYGAPEWAYGTEPNVYFRDKLSGLIPGKILLPAEGEGRNAAFAASRGWAVEAFDLSVEGKNKADRLAADMGRRIEYVVADAMEVSYRPESVDVVAFIYAHFPWEVRKVVYPKLVASLKPGGMVILEAFGKKQLEYQPHQASGGPKDADLLFSLDEIRELFPDFEVLEMLEGEVRLHEGLYHNGQGWVCRFLGVKK
jgi:hypothetical protein